MLLDDALASCAGVDPAAADLGAGFYGATTADGGCVVLEVASYCARVGLSGFRIIRRVSGIRGFWFRGWIFESVFGVGSDFKFGFRF